MTPLANHSPEIWTVQSTRKSVFFSDRSTDWHDCGEQTKNSTSDERKKKNCGQISCSLPLSGRSMVALWPDLGPMGSLSHKKVAIRREGFALQLVPEFLLIGDSTRPICDESETFACIVIHIGFEWLAQLLCTMDPTRKVVQADPSPVGPWKTDIIGEGISHHKRVVHAFDFAFELVDLLLRHNWLVRHDENATKCPSMIELCKGSTRICWTKE